MIPLHPFVVLLLLLRSAVPDLAADRAALLRLREAVGGRTAGWNTTDETPCFWEGITCDNTTSRVSAIRLPGDGLSGPIPPSTVGNLTGLRVLSLRKNSLSGELPQDLRACTLLKILHLRGNRFSGEIPNYLFTLQNLAILNLARNEFSGSMSPDFNRLTGLRNLSLEENQFTGTIPDLDALSGLRTFNVSANYLTGQIPTGLGNKFDRSSFLGNSLCGEPLEPCRNHPGNNLSGGVVAGIAVGAVLIIILIVIILVIVRTKLKSRKIQPQTQQPSPALSSPENPQIQDTNQNPDSTTVEITPSSDTLHSKEGSKTTVCKSSSDGLTFFGDDVEVFTLAELLRASAEIIGKGTVGSTYKAYFDSGVEVIVKRLKNVCLSEENFRAKIEEIGSLVHDHLEPLRGYFYGRDEKLLLYEPMPNGSLSELLHGNKKGPVSWKIRTKIATGCARGVAYLHSISPNTFHGNIKSSNVFLSDYYNARVSEFGLTQLVLPISVLNGYRAPEVTDTRKASQPADVHAFGVLILELVTGKLPDRALAEEGIELPSWVESIGPEKWKDEVFDPDLVRFDLAEEEMMQVVHLAVACAGRSPDRRPSMAEVVGRIEEICG